MREVYIVQSRHEVDEIKIPEEKVSREIIRDIILEEKIKMLFFDSCSSDDASSHNEEINRIERSPHYEPEIIDEWIKLAVDCRRRGVKVKYKETESETILGLEDFIDDLQCLWNDMYELIGYKRKVGKIEIGIENIVLRLRDSRIYKNLREKAGSKSVLYMGGAHQLVDFYKPNSGFAVAAVTIRQQGPQYRYANRDGVPDFFREIVERRYAEMK